VFQLYNLVPSLTALENVQLIAEITGPDAERRALQALDTVGMGERADAFPGQLSGGQQQRVATARAIVKHPSVLLCDEPTGSLDLDRGREVLEVLAELTDEGRTVLCVTHNSAIAQMATRVLRLSDGRIIDDIRQSDPRPARELIW
jgi:putative ABC transport system ATP-binding protein